MKKPVPGLYMAGDFLKNEREMLFNQELVLAGQKSIEGKMFKVVLGKHVPYDSSAEVLSTIPASRRHIGQVFKVLNGSAIEDWHFVGGIDDADLILKTGTSTAWGSIPGTLSDQTDLQAALDAKLDDIFPGTGVNIDKTDPLNPVINAVSSASGKYVISGGAVWSGSGLTYDVSNISFYWNGNKTAAATSKTLADSDPTNNRLDALVVDESGNITVITGTPSASPITPAIPVDQLLIQYILVEAGSVTPTVSEEDIYLDNGQWTFANYTTSGTQVGTSNPDATDSPKQGTKCIDNSLDGRTGIRFNKGATFDLSGVTTLALWVRFTAVQSNKMKLNARFEDATLTPVGNEIDLFNYGLQKSVTGTWQLAVIPLSVFGGITTVQGFRMILTGGANGTQIEWDVDFITLTNGSTPIITSPTIAFYKDSAKVADQKGIDIVQGTGMTITALEDPVKGTVKYTLESTSAGPAGESAYQVAVDNGFVGTEAEWLASLQGPAGADGATGATGESAYQVAVDNGFVGTEAEWLTSLQGADGPQGPAGQGVPAGGTVNQILAKNSATDYDTAWVDPPTGGGGGSSTAGNSLFLYYNFK